MRFSVFVTAITACGVFGPASATADPVGDRAAGRVGLLTVTDFPASEGWTVAVPPTSSGLGVYAPVHVNQFCPGMGTLGKLAATAGQDSTTFEHSDAFAANTVYVFSSTTVAAKFVRLARRPDCLPAAFNRLRARLRLDGKPARLRNVHDRRVLHAQGVDEATSYAAILAPSVASDIVIARVAGRAVAVYAFWNRRTDQNALASSLQRLQQSVSK